jgi:hypothetical protein
MYRRLCFATLLLLAVVAWTGSATAARLPVRGLPNQLLDDIVVPSEWDGVWTVEDSVYTNCNSGSATYSMDEDTLCSGEHYSQSPDPSCQLTCSGSASSGAIDATCTGECELEGGCIATYTVHTTGTRSADSYQITTTINVTYSGTGEFCGLLPPTCTKIVSYGTRTAPAPPAYCLTPTKESTWGRLKIRYR